MITPFSHEVGIIPVSRTLLNCLVYNSSINSIVVFRYSFRILWLGLDALQFFRLCMQAQISDSVIGELKSKMFACWSIIPLNCSWLGSELMQDCKAGSTLSPYSCSSCFTTCKWKKVMQISQTCMDRHFPYFYSNFIYVSITGGRWVAMTFTIRIEKK